MKQIYDVIIIGGGIVGASLALILAKASFAVAVVEVAKPFSGPPKYSTDKNIALAFSSRVIFESMGIWSELEKQSCLVSSIHVSDKNHFGSAFLSAEEVALPALGYVTPANIIAYQLHNQLQKFANVTLFQPANFLAYKYDGCKVCVQVKQGEEIIELESRMMVAADGQNSAVRQFLGLKTEGFDYQQVAIICNATLKRSHYHVAYERFTDQGPLAMLPLNDHASAVIWTVNADQAQELLALPNDLFCRQLQLRFGYRLGKILNCSKPVAHPLQFSIAPQQVFPGLVMLGNAVHTLHPVAAQGFNLALRDLALLAEEFSKNIKKGLTLGDIHTWQAYLQQRLKDQRQTILLTNALVSIFSLPSLPYAFARNTGLILLDRVTSLKQKFIKRALGVTGKMPRLACGMDLE